MITLRSQNDFKGARFSLATAMGFLTRIHVRLWQHRHNGEEGGGSDWEGAQSRYNKGF